MLVGGADASQKGLGDLIPAKSTLRSAITFSLLRTLSQIVNYRREEQATRFAQKTGQ
jgi:hypothetical protein